MPITLVDFPGGTQIQSAPERSCGSARTFFCLGFSHELRMAKGATREYLASCRASWRFLPVRVGRLDIVLDFVWNKGLRAGLRFVVSTSSHKTSVRIKISHSRVQPVCVSSILLPSEAVLRPYDRWRTGLITQILGQFDACLDVVSTDSESVLRWL